MFELVEDGGTIKVAEERHYELVQSDAITSADLSAYRKLAKD